MERPLFGENLKEGLLILPSLVGGGSKHPGMSYFQYLFFLNDNLVYMQQFPYQTVLPAHELQEGEGGMLSMTSEDSWSMCTYFFHYLQLPS